MIVNREGCKSETAELRRSLSETRKVFNDNQTRLQDLQSTAGDFGLESSYLKQQLVFSQAESERNAALLSVTTAEA
jgi:hypothetical protein